MFTLWHELNNRRAKEKTIAYAESHDQGLVGDKTIAMWLMDAEMYSAMSVFQQSLIIDRGIALHKLIRLITLALGGEGYLNFIGNEFGHPEWIDFPREGNNWSYQYARRQWSLPDTDYLRYKDLRAFDAAMIGAAAAANLLSDAHAQQRYLQNDRKLLAFERGGLVFAFNFHPTEAATDFAFRVSAAGSYQTVLCSDDATFGGFGRIDAAHAYPSFSVADEDSEILHQEISVYLPPRTALVLRRV